MYRLLSSRPMEFVGLVSYSFYLWHWPALAFARHWTGGAELALSVSMPAIAVAFVLSVLSFRFVERPFRRRRDGGGAGTMRVLAGASAVTVALGGIGLAIALADGVPGCLAPSVKAAFAGAEDINPDREACFRREPANGLCRFEAAGKEPRADVLLGGDSHADAAWPGVRAWAREAGLDASFAGRDSCPPVTGVARDDAKFDSCTGFNDRVLTHVVEGEAHDLVILHARWPPLSVEGARTGHGAELRLRDGSSVAHDADGNASLLDAGLTRTAEALRRSGRDVVLLGSVPGIPFVVPAAAARAARLGIPVPVGPSAAALTARQRRSETLLRRVAEATGALYLDLGGAFCAPDCAVVDSDGRPLYVDDHHVSATAARRRIAPALSVALPAGETVGRAVGAPR